MKLLKHDLLLQKIVTYQLDDNVQPYVGKRRDKELKIAGVFSEKLFKGLSFEADLHPLSPEDYDLILRSVDIDFILIESCLESSTGDWMYAGFVGSEHNNKFIELIELGKSKNIPVVFWNTLDMVYDSLFSGVYECFDRVFIADKRLFLEYEKRDSRRYRYLPQGVQPSLFNPVKTVSEISSPSNWRIESCFPT